MSQHRKKHLFYKNGQLSSEMGSDLVVTVFSTTNTPLAEQHLNGRTTEASLLALDSQASVLNSFHRYHIHNLVYSAYGRSNTEHNIVSFLGFTGQRYDDVTNCYFLGNGYRAFSPRLARFYSADSLSPFTKHTHNSYAYCLGDPVNYHDPSGHMLRRVNTLLNNAKARFAKPRIHYINKAREAITKHPALEKYSVVIDSPNVTKDALKAIYRIPKGDAMLGNLRDTAVLNWRFKNGNIEGPITQDFNYLKHLDIDDQLNYIALDSKIHKYKTMLTNLMPHESPESSCPATAGSVIRGS